MRAKIVLGVFTGLAVSWALAVVNATAKWDAWKAWGLALFGAFWIGAIGLRLYHIINEKNVLKKLAIPKPEVSTSQKPTSG